MKYLCLIYDEEKKEDAMSQSESEAFMREYFAFSEGLRKSGHYIGGEGPPSPQTPPTPRGRHRKLTTTDGPFVRTKEETGGGFLINPQDPNEAIPVGSKNPSRRLGSNEVRAR